MDGWQKTPTVTGGKPFLPHRLHLRIPFAPVQWLKTAFKNLAKPRFQTISPAARCPHRCGIT
jgi:hypothetical protein